MYNPSTCFHLCLLPVFCCVLFVLLSVLCICFLFYCRFSVFVLLLSVHCICSVVVGSLYLFSVLLSVLCICCCCRCSVFVLLLSVLCICFVCSVVSSLYFVCSVVVGDASLTENHLVMIACLFFALCSCLCTSFCPYFCFYVLAVCLFAIFERKKQLMTEHSVRNRYSIVSTSAKHGRH